MAESITIKPQDIDAGSNRRWTVLLIVLAVGSCLSALGNFYFYDDGRLLREAARVESDGWRVIFEPGFNDHWRPLAIGSAYLARCWFGAESPLPLHLLAIGLHAINIRLLFGLLLRLRLPTMVAGMAAGVAAVHWAASEAVTCIFGLGVLYSVLGGLIAARGAARWRDVADWRAWLAIVGGVGISLAGGEYGVAMAPVIVACALWPRADGALCWRRGLAIVALLAPIYGVYVAASAMNNDHGRLGVDYRLGPHVALYTADDVSYLLFPNKWLRRGPCLLVAAMAVAIGCAMSGGFRRQLLSWPAALLFAASLGALVPFVLCVANYYRYLYPAMGLFLAGMFLLIETALRSEQLSPAIARRAMVGVAVLFLAANLVNGQRRIAEERRRGNEVVRFLRELESLEETHPGQTIDVRVSDDVESAMETAIALARIPRERCHRALPTAPISAGHVLLVADYAWGHPYALRVFEPGMVADVRGDDSPRR